FCSPVTGRAHSVIFAANNKQPGTIFLIFHGSIIKWHHFACWPVCGVAAFFTLSQEVTDTNIRNCTAHHHFMVTAAGPVCFQVSRLSTFMLPILSCWHILCDWPCR